MVLEVLDLVPGIILLGSTCIANLLPLPVEGGINPWSASLGTFAVSAGEVACFSWE